MNGFPVSQYGVSPNSKLLRPKLVDRRYKLVDVNKLMIELERENGDEFTFHNSRIMTS